MEKPTKQEVRENINRCGKEGKTALERGCCGVIFIMNFFCHKIHSCSSCRKKWFAELKEDFLVLFRFILHISCKPLWVTISFRNFSDLEGNRSFITKTLTDMRNFKIYSYEVDKIWCAGLEKWEEAFRIKAKKQGKTERQIEIDVQVKKDEHKRKYKKFLKIAKKSAVKEKKRKKEYFWFRLTSIILIGKDVLETKRGRDNKWNMHLHGIWGVRCPVPQPFLAELLRRITGEKHVHVYLKPLESAEKAALYLSKYVKKNELSPDDRLEVDYILFGKKLKRLIGGKQTKALFKAFKEKQKENRCCPYCGDKDTSVGIVGTFIREEKYGGESSITLDIFGTALKFCSFEYKNSRILFSMNNLSVVGENYCWFYYTEDINYRVIEKLLGETNEKRLKKKAV